jgi:hypothetical protein
MEFEPLDEFADKVATIDMDTNTEFLKAKTLFMRLETIINLYSKSNCPPTSLARDSNRKAVLGRTHGITTRAMEWVEGDRALPSRILGWPDTIALLLAIYALSKSAIPLLTVIVDDCKRINQELHDNLDAHAKRMKRLDAELGAEKKPVDEPVDEPAALSPIEKRDISNEKRWTLRLELCQRGKLFDHVNEVLMRVDEILWGKTKMDALLLSAIKNVPIKVCVKRPRHVGIEEDEDFDDLSK